MNSRWLAILLAMSVIGAGLPTLRPPLVSVKRPIPLSEPGKVKVPEAGVEDDCGDTSDGHGSLDLCLLAIDFGRLISLSRCSCEAALWLPATRLQGDNSRAPPADIL